MQNAVATARKDDPAPQSSPVVYKLRDFNHNMVAAWEQSFAAYPDCVEVSQGDIFKGGPSADAIVSPANSFGFMDGGIDMVFSQHFGWQMMERLQEEIKSQKDGELLVGDALIIPSYPSKEAKEQVEAKTEVPDLSIYNEGKPIQYLISAPTMRTPQDVRGTVNAYLAFRAVILAVKRHNADSSKDPIHTVLCSGLGTYAGRMPEEICANQMLLAYETFDLGLHEERFSPKSLWHMLADEEKMKQSKQA